MVTPVGLDTETSWEGLIAGKSGIGPITQFDDKGIPTQIAGEVKGFDAAKFIEPKEIKKMDRFIHLALAASQMAMDDAKLVISPENADRIGVIAGAGIGGLPAIERSYRAYMEKGYRRITPFFIPMAIINELAGHISMRFDAKGPNISVVTACATGTHSIGDAFKWIQRGDADAMIAGGAEATICPLAVGGFNAMKALSTRNSEPERASRPFDAQRDGFVMGEGAGLVILEDLEFAQKRGARIIAEVIGYGASGDAYHITSPAPNGEGAARCMSLAIKDAGISPAEVGYINAHGTSTKYGDELETMAIKTVFGGHARAVPISSTKSMTGHLLGAAGGVEAVISILALERGILPPTINLENPDPECDLDYIPNTARKKQVDIAISNSFGFGGTNATLVFRKFRP
ncbi:MAG: beta-ketoacyl-ACP synthase II [Nitrospirae bacterium]|nr:beta-ketoacyl-ACP synthase II [Nitrospirota bacterium]NTW65718.1 beta-ketoacyl-ACP synthase II [Nitrospirota bacterium]